MAGGIDVGFVPGVAPGRKTSSAGRLISIIALPTPGLTDVPVPNGATSCDLIVRGAGASGSAGGASSGGGGGAEEVLCGLDVTSGGVLTARVGSGGAATAASNGIDGNPSSVSYKGKVVVSAAPGKGAIGGTPGLGGVATTPGGSGSAGVGGIGGGSGQTVPVPGPDYDNNTPAGVAGQLGTGGSRGSSSDAKNSGRGGHGIVTLIFRGA